MKSYSQNNEQEIILKYFGDFKGRFLDIGAYNGYDISNTRALLELGWEGTLVEPNPVNLVDLINNSKEFGERAQIISAAVHPRVGMARLFQDMRPGRGWAASVVLEKLDDNYDVTGAALMVPCVQMSDLFPLGPFDFISIDAEYLDYQILQSCTVGELEHCRMLIIEAVERDDIRRVLSELGFKLHAETPENLIAAR